MRKEILRAYFMHFEVWQQIFLGAVCSNSLSGLSWRAPNEKRGRRGRRDFNRRKCSIHVSVTIVFVPPLPLTEILNYPALCALSLAPARCRRRSNPSSLRRLQHRALFRVCWHFWQCALIVLSACLFSKECGFWRGEAWKWQLFLLRRFTHIF